MTTATAGILDPVRLHSENDIVTHRAYLLGRDGERARWTKLSSGRRDCIEAGLSLSECECSEYTITRVLPAACGAPSLGGHHRARRRWWGCCPTLYSLSAPFQTAPSSEDLHAAGIR
jgi:hypothetical protein